MLLTTNRLLPGTGMHQMIRLLMGIPRFGGLTIHEGEKHA
jgi:hypothetical protein